MNKYLLPAALALSFTLSTTAQATTAYGDGCNVWGPVSYLYAAEGGVIMTLVNGYACVINGVTDRSAVSAAAAILSQAQTTGRNANISVSGSGQLLIAMN